MSSHTTALGLTTLIALVALGSACGSEVQVGFGSSGGGGTGATGGSSNSVGGMASSSSVGGSGIGCDADCSLIDTPQCQVARCNEATRECEVVDAELGTVCDDGLFCTDGDACSAGSCVGGPQNTCGLPAQACNTITCNESNQSCSQAPAMNGAPCQDPNLCIKGSTCSNGQCSGGTLDDCFFTPVGVCEQATCNPNNGMCEVGDAPNGTACTDPGALCTVNQTCLAGMCQGGSPKDCSVLNQGCLVGACNTFNGQCMQAPAPNGQSCDDFNSCTSGETCTNSVCGGGVSITQCINGDGCCPNNCTANNDSDCGVIVRAAVNRGWWRDDGFHDANNNNTFTGRTNAGIHNAYFIFDLSGISASQVVSAELHLEVEAYFGNDPFEPISLWDVSTPSTTLEASGNSVAIHNDLMQGATYGGATVLSTEVNTIKVFTLNTQARTDILGALGGDFSVGVHADNIGMFGTEAVRWSNMGINVHELHLIVLP